VRMASKVSMLLYPFKLDVRQRAPRRPSAMRGIPHANASILHVAPLNGYGSHSGKIGIG
jgi:hypothetical protein